ncbi:MAG: hypothetical protein JST92_17365 [Deltaproteobacteria bacterium]|nr:hypothetical protein [Deltaproteobacteria bacterium]
MTSVVYQVPTSPGPLTQDELFLQAANDRFVWLDSPPAIALLVGDHSIAMPSQSEIELARTLRRRGLGAITVGLRELNESLEDAVPLDVWSLVGRIAAAREWLHRFHPELPVVLVGEGDAGAAALLAAASCPRDYFAVVARSSPSLEHVSLGGLELPCLLVVDVTDDVRTCAARELLVQLPRDATLVTLGGVAPSAHAESREAAIAELLETWIVDHLPRPAHARAAGGHAYPRRPSAALDH